MKTTEFTSKSNFIRQKAAENLYVSRKISRQIDLELFANSVIFIFHCLFIR